MGGVAKPMLKVGARTMLALALDAADALGCRPVVVAGPRPHDDALAERATWVREDPPLGGPVAGIVAALATIGEPAPEWTLVLACDLPEAAAVAVLLRDGVDGLSTAVDGRCLSVSGRQQWLCGLYRTDALRSAAASLANAGVGASMRTLLAGLDLDTVEAPAALAGDVDTWDDLVKARARAAVARAGIEEAP